MLDPQQRSQAPRLGPLGQAVGDDLGEPDRVGAEVAIVGAPRGGDERLVVGEVDDGEHVGKPLVQILGHLELDAGGDDLALGPDDPLREGLLVDEERPRDLGRGQADDGAQGQREPRLRRQRRVAAREQQRQPVVLVVTDVLVGRDASSAGGPASRSTARACRPRDRSRSSALRWAAVVSQAAGRRGVPSRRQLRECLDHRALYRLLGDVEVAEAAVQGGDQAARLLADRGRQQPVAAASSVRHSNWL